MGVAQKRMVFSDGEGGIQTYQLLLIYWVSRDKNQSFSLTALYMYLYHHAPTALNYEILLYVDMPPYIVSLHCLITILQHDNTMYDSRNGRLSPWIFVRAGGRIRKNHQQIVVLTRRSSIPCLEAGGC